jgi:hypothetical protein
MWPPGPTCSHSQRATEPRPPPTFQAASARRQAEPADSALGERVEALGEQVQAAPLIGAGVRKRIVRRDLSHLPASIAAARAIPTRPR